MRSKNDEYHFSNSNVMSSPNGVTDTQLLSLIGKHDQKAFDLLYDVYGAQLYGAISRSITCSKTANRVFRETLEEIWKQIDRFNPEKEHLLYWLMTVVRKSLASYHQNKSAAATCQFSYATNSIAIISNNKSGGTTFTLAMLHDSDVSALHTLTERQRMIFLAAYYRGANMTEMVKLLNMSPLCVKRLLQLFFVTLKK